MTRGFRKVPNWKTGLFGPGIIDALKVLEAPIPSATTPHLVSKAAPPRQEKFDQVASLFDDVPRPELRRALAELLNTPETLLPKRLDDVGDELLFHFYSDGKMRQDFRARFSNKISKAKSSKKSRLRATTPGTAAAPAGLAAIASSRLAAHVTRRTIPHP